MPALLARAAAPADAPAIAGISNEGIAARVATFETRERPADEVRGWLGTGLPFIVATANDEVVGWGAGRPVLRPLRVLGRRRQRVIGDAAP